MLLMSENRAKNDTTHVKNYCTLKRARVCQAGQVCICSLYQHVPRALVCVILTVGNTECYLFIYLFILVTTHLRLTNSSHISTNKHINFISRMYLNLNLKKKRKKKKKKKKKKKNKQIQRIYVPRLNCLVTQI